MLRSRLDEVDGPDFTRLEFLRRDVALERVHAAARRDSVHHVAPQYSAISRMFRSR